jgi:hypothetical protein
MAEVQSVSNKAAVCCGSSGGEKKQVRYYQEGHSWIKGYADTPAGKAPVILAKWGWKDYLGELLVRLGAGRMKYRIKPGLYGTGSPDGDSPVLVSANYKLSFDKLRKELSGISAWILVLDTKGINVWCAAGKGTFGTKELVNKIIEFKLDKLVKHRDVIVPQLGATGVAAHQVAAFTRFRVHYGPVRAKDLPYYLKNRFTKTPEMKEVRFGWLDRLVLVPIELTGSLTALIILLAVFAAARLITAHGFSTLFIRDFLPYLAAVLAGNFLTPLLLPWIPGKPFAVKGLITGIMAAAGAVLLMHPDWKMALAYFLALPAISSFIAMNFTGASTFTSLKGAQLEVKIGLPAQLIAALAGFGLQFLVLFKVI